VSDRPGGAAWSLGFARRDGTGGFVRLVRWSDRAWYWTYVASPAWGLVVVRDHDVALPRPGSTVLVRADGLWAELIPETPGEHWTVGVEAFGVRLDDPLEAERGERGERLPVGLDLEWEVGSAPYGIVHGELLLGDERVAFDGTGALEEATIPEHAWSRPRRRLSWQRDGSTGRTARDDAVELDLDGAGLPTAARADGVAFDVAATAVVPVGARLVLGLVTAADASGWLEWCPGPPESVRRAGS
jgi:hypothetical protein